MLYRQAKNILKKTFLLDMYKSWIRYKIKKNPIEESKKSYFKYYNRELNLENPQLLSEKIQFLKLFTYPKNPLVIEAADKYTIRNYLNTKSLEKYSMPFIFVYSTPEAIDFEKLPQKFVLKRTNASGMNLIVKDKGDISKKEIITLTKKWLSIDFGDMSAEYHYSQAESKIICEPFIENLGNEYRLFMVDGRLAFVQVIIWYWDNGSEGDTTIEGHRKHSRIHLDDNWNVLWKDEEVTESKFIKPSFFDEMKEVSETIAKDFPVVRVDFNEIDNGIKIMELTFTPASGFLEVLRQNPDLDVKLGTWISMERLNEKHI